MQMIRRSFSQYPKAVGLVFPFNEVNAGVFQNAGLYAAKKNFGSETTVYTPNQFRGLYFAVDKVVVIDPVPYRTYQEVAEFEPNLIYKKDLSTYFSKGMLNYLHHVSLEMLPANLYHALPMYMRSDYKTRKYLVKSGIFKLTKKDYYSTNPKVSSIFYDAGLYINLAKFEKKKKNLSQYFQYSFANLYNMITSGDLNYIGNIIDSERLLIENPLKFLKQIKTNSPKIFLRTRNINNSVSFQNAPVLELAKLVQELLNHGFVVINSGCPAVHLNIKNNNYLEFSHNLPIATEMYLANYCDYVMQTAWAGLFTAYASYNKPLITFDNEWSLSNLVEPISLLKARKNIGLRDIDISATFSRTRYSIGDSITKIISNW
jgi:hypothetical protein